MEIEVHKVKIWSQMMLYYVMHVRCFSVFVYEIEGEIACGLNVWIEVEYGWLLCGKFQN